MGSFRKLLFGVAQSALYGGIAYGTGLTAFVAKLVGRAMNPANGISISLIIGGALACILTLTWPLYEPQIKRLMGHRQARRGKPPPRPQFSGATLPKTEPDLPEGVTYGDGEPPTVIVRRPSVPPFPTGTFEAYEKELERMRKARRADLPEGASEGIVSIGGKGNTIKGVIKNLPPGSRYVYSEGEENANYDVNISGGESPLDRSYRMLDAAYLWYGLEPPLRVAGEHPPYPNANVRNRHILIQEAYKTGAFPNAQDIKRNDGTYTFIPHDDLKRWAESRGERPPFLFERFEARHVTR